VRRPAGRLEGFEAMENRLEGVQHLRILGSAVAGPDCGGASLGDVDQSRRGDDGIVIGTLLTNQTTVIVDTTITTNWSGRQNKSFSLRVCVLFAASGGRIKERGKLYAVHASNTWAACPFLPIKM
jgi:hypothetical protein